jgi:hypothetical protein
VTVPRRRRQKFDPWQDRRDQLGAILGVLDQGGTLREAARAAGIDEATLRRWKTAFPDVSAALQTAQQCGDLVALRRLLAQPALAPERRRERGLPVSYSCPRCSGDLVVRTCDGVYRIWRCATKDCGFVSWRPRHLLNCLFCGAARFWSHSRRSVSCSRCGRRWAVPEAK